jgi:hypothetical protein
MLHYKVLLLGEVLLTLTNVGFNPEVETSSRNLPVVGKRGRPAARQIENLGNHRARRETRIPLLSLWIS